jgi:catechol 2,3-dioxygenase-like lactoylglutathione lyase family enzyme
LLLLPALAAAGWLSVRAQDVGGGNPAHFHHVHLNVTDIQRSTDFYQRVFGAVPVKFNGRSDALFTERSFLLLNKVAAAPPAAPTTAMWHLGWGGVDLPNEFAWWKSKGIEFETPLTPFGANYYMYMYGPDREVIEIYSGEQNHRYNHVHLLSADMNRATQWYADLLGITLRRREVPRPADAAALWANAIRVDNVTINIFARPEREPVPGWYGKRPLTAFEPTRGSVVDHIAFSFRRIEPVLEHARAMGATVTAPIAVQPDTGVKSFFLQGPDGVLVEIVEARPIPDASWEGQ